MGKSTSSRVSRRGSILERQSIQVERFAEATVHFHDPEAPLASRLAPRIEMQSLYTRAPHAGSRFAAQHQKVGAKAESLLANTVHRLLYELVAVGSGVFKQNDRDRGGCEQSQLTHFP